MREFNLAQLIGDYMRELFCTETKKIIVNLPCVNLKLCYIHVPHESSNLLTFFFLGTEAKFKTEKQSIKRKKETETRP